MSQQLPVPVMKIVLGHQLERLRQEAGLTQEDVAAVLGCSQQKIGYMESGGGTRRTELALLMDTFRASEADRSYLLELHAACSQRLKPGGFRARFRQYLRLLIDMESTCRRLCSYRAMVVPGLLQTEDYMRTLFKAWRPSPTPEQIDRDTADRLARQHVLDNLDQQFWFVLDEAVLRRMAGGPRVMKAQVLRLVEVIDRPNVELQVVPFAAGYYMGQACDYTIFEYHIEPQVNIVYLDRHYDGEYVDELKQTTEYATLWEQQRAAASGPEQSRSILLDLVGSL